MTTLSRTTPLRESGGRVLSEARGGKMLFRIIQAGWGSSGYYSREVLRRDGPLMFKAGTHVYVDHPTLSEQRERPERSVRDLAGALLSDAQWRDSGPHGSGLFADVRIARQDLREMLPDLADMIGVSIQARGTARYGEAEGWSGHIIEKIVAVDSVDIVTRPGAGGAVLMESLRARQSEPTGQERLNASLANLERTIKSLPPEAQDRLYGVNRSQSRESSARRLGESLGYTGEALDQFTYGRDTKRLYEAEAATVPPDQRRLYVAWRRMGYSDAAARDMARGRDR